MALEKEWNVKTSTLVLMGLLCVLMFTFNIYVLPKFMDDTKVENKTDLTYYTISCNDACISSNGYSGWFDYFSKEKSTRSCYDSYYLNVKQLNHCCDIEKVEWDD